MPESDLYTNQLDWFNTSESISFFPQQLIVFRYHVGWWRHPSRCGWYQYWSSSVGAAIYGVWSVMGVPNSSFAETTYACSSLDRRTVKRQKRREKGWYAVGMSCRSKLRMCDATPTLWTATLRNHRLVQYWHRCSETVAHMTHKSIPFCKDIMHWP